MSFNAFQLHPDITAGILACGFTEPTPIQRQAIPVVMQGRDVLGLAQTGTGKTAAFVLPMLQRLMAGPRKKVRTLVVAPTRELAEQIHSDIGRLSRNTGVKSVAVYGGVSKHLQTKALRAGVEIIVACPGRLLDHLSGGWLDLSTVELLVLDEADHMFDMGFLPAIRKIVAHLPTSRQTLLFSATMPQEIRKLSQEVLRNPLTVQVDTVKPAITVSQRLFPVEQKEKTGLLKKITRQTDMTCALVFTRTKHRAKNLARQLYDAGFNATSLHGNLSQAKRQQALDGFRRGSYKILVATDIAARGIDVSGISHVINFDMPDTVEAYTHRIGRTGRANRTGEAFTFFSREDWKLVQMIERSTGQTISREKETQSAAAKDDAVASRRTATGGQGRGCDRAAAAHVSRPGKAAGGSRRRGQTDKPLHQQGVRQ